MTDMDPKTLEALKASIAKWEKNARVRACQSARIRSIDCPLCEMFFPKTAKDGCAQKCPVKQKSGTNFCRNTPYETAYYARCDWNKDRTNKHLARAFRDAARNEVAFLRSLLPGSAQ